MPQLYRKDRIELAKSLLVTSLIKDSCPFSNKQDVVSFLLDFFDSPKPKCLRKKDLIKYNVLSADDRFFYKFIDMMHKHNYFIIKKIDRTDDTGRNYFYFLAEPGEKIKDLLTATKDKRGSSIYKENLILNNYVCDYSQETLKNKYYREYNK